MPHAMCASRASGFLDRCDARGSVASLTGLPPSLLPVFSQLVGLRLDGFLESGPVDGVRNTPPALPEQPPRT